jgi:Zn-dependent protease
LRQRHFALTLRGIPQSSTRGAVLDEREIGGFLFKLPVFLLAVIVHECAHGVVALWRGDPTAKYAGRITLNPVPHIDLYGSIILPGLLLLSPGGILIGWAKPVPIDPRNFRHKIDGILVAAAGPFSNIFLGFLFALLYSVGYRMQLGPVLLIAGWGVGINCVLAIFNLLPIPPLDGHWVALRLLPPNLARAYARIGFWGIIVIFLLLMIPVVRLYLVAKPVNFLVGLLLQAAGLPKEILP